MGMIYLHDDAILLFGGEDNHSEDSDKTFVLNRTAENSYTVHKGSGLPTSCTPATTSYMLNNSSFYYFISNEGYVFRLNKIEMKWSKW